MCAARQASPALCGDCAVYMARIRVGAWRDDSSGPMQVVSGYAGREKVHYQAPPAHTLAAETDNFLQWFNAIAAGDALIKAGLAHLWLVTLHPFDDGAGARGVAQAGGRGKKYGV